MIFTGGGVEGRGESPFRRDDKGRPVPGSEI